jgi:hypothetical protein
MGFPSFPTFPIFPASSSQTVRPLFSAVHATKIGYKWATGFCLVRLSSLTSPPPILLFISFGLLPCAMAQIYLPLQFINFPLANKLNFIC